MFSKHIYVVIVICRFQILQKHITFNVSLILKLILNFLEEKKVKNKDVLIPLAKTCPGIKSQQYGLKSWCFPVLTKASRSLAKKPAKIKKATLVRKKCTMSPC